MSAEVVFISTSMANASIFQQRKTASQVTIQASNVSNKQFNSAAFSDSFKVLFFSKYHVMVGLRKV